MLGGSAAAYHAGFEPSVRERVQTRLPRLEN
jgi:superfamily II DNA helicase RecQ